MLLSFEPQVCVFQRTVLQVSAIPTPSTQLHKLYYLRNIDKCICSTYTVPVFVTALDKITYIAGIIQNIN
jgi:hypothetical protein